MSVKFKSLVGAAVLALASSGLQAAEAVKNVVLVHGAFVDASIWNGVSERLLDKGYTVRAVQLPLTSLDDDVAATEAVLERMAGPVLLVGYSWGGVPATVAGTDPDVKGLVYFAAVTPEPGQSLGAMLEPYNEVAMPGAVELELDESRQQYWLKPEGLHNALSHDAPSSTARLMGTAQKPTAAQIFTDIPDRAAWQSKPSWYVIASEDRIFPVPLQHALAKSIGATTVEWPTGHAAILSRPGSAAALIDAAALSLSSDEGHVKKP